MPTYAFLIIPLVVAIASIVLIAWRQHRAGDYAERLDPRDNPDGSHSKAMGMAAAAARSRNTGSGGTFF